MYTVQIGGGEGCCPIRVAYMGPAGRGLVATRHINQGEVIFLTQPAVIGPCVRQVTFLLYHAEPNHLTVMLFPPPAPVQALLYIFTSWQSI
jgi:hypothetical protein